jgi:hypothetical protein
MSVEGQGAIGLLEDFPCNLHRAFIYFAMFATKLVQLHHDEGLHGH